MSKRSEMSSGSAARPRRNRTAESGVRQLSANAPALDVNIEGAKSFALANGVAEGSAIVIDCGDERQELVAMRVRMRELEKQLAECAREKSVLYTELDAIHKAAISDKVVMRDYVRALHEETAEIPQLRQAEKRLFAQTEEIITSIQAESAALVALIDVVQSSHFWKVKHWLNRLRATLLRR